MNKYYEALFKSLKAYDDLTQIHSYLFQSNHFNYDEDSEFLQDLECTLLNLKDFIDHLLEKTN